MKKPGICLLLVCLLFCGCTGKSDTVEIPSTPCEEIESIPNLLCCISASDTDEACVLTGDVVYTLYRTVNTAIALSSFNPNDPPPAPTDETAVYAVFYVEGEGADTETADGSGGGYLASATAFYGSYTVYESGYAQFSLTPLHSDSHAYFVGSSAYFFLYSCLTTPTWEEMTDLTCAVTQADEAWTLDGEDAKALYDSLAQSLRKTAPRHDNTAEASVKLSFHSDDVALFDGELGHYWIYENGYVVYSRSLYTSALHYYEIDGSAYEEILALLEGLRAGDGV